MVEPEQPHLLSKDAMVSKEAPIGDPEKVKKNQKSKGVYCNILLQKSSPKSNLSFFSNIIFNRTWLFHYYHARIRVFFLVAISLTL